MFVSMNWVSIGIDFRKKDPSNSLSMSTVVDIPGVQSSEHLCEWFSSNQTRLGCE